MSPTVFTNKGYRYFFFSREESCMHVHVLCGHGEAKFWIEPVIALAQSSGMKPKELREVQKVIEEKSGEIVKAWKKHFN
jgi:hypothetical protein